ncbi:MAG: phosphoheptose isomerase, partial [Bacteroidales bacterium]|nr:phosphoheptose isomerase [Bacteroidales bacterium]
MSFMYNPFPFHDPKPVNRPELSKKTVDSIVAGGTPNVAKKFVTTIADKAKKEGVVVAFDGYTTADWKQMIGLISRECDLLGLQFEDMDCNAATLKSGKEIDAMIDPLLIWDTKIDPTLLYGKVYHGGYIG